MDLLAIVIYGQPSRAEKTEGRNWITTIVVHRGGADAKQLASATFKAARRFVHMDTRIEVHHAGAIAELPKGKAYDGPDWTDGDVRVWLCPMLGDLAPAVDPNASPPTHIYDNGPSYGHRHIDERMRRG